MLRAFFYIADRHDGQLQVSLDKGQYNTLDSIEERNLAAAKSAGFSRGVSLGTPRVFPWSYLKSILIPRR